MSPIMSLWGGVPARVIGDFEGFIKKRINESSIDGDSYTPDGEVISNNLESKLWHVFSQSKNSTLGK